jgi:ketopantoate reductase
MLIGITSHTVVPMGLARYKHAGVRDSRLGPSRGIDLTSARLGASIFSRPGMPVEVLSEKEIRTAQWARFVFNCGGLAAWAFTFLSIVGSKDQPLLIDLMEALIRETCEIAAREGIVLHVDEGVAFLCTFIVTATRGKASMRGDIQARRRREIDTINGAAVMFADRHGHPAVLNRAMVALVKGTAKAMQSGEA